MGCLIRTIQVIRMIGIRFTRATGGADIALHWFVICNRVNTIPLRSITIRRDSLRFITNPVDRLNTNLGIQGRLHFY